MMPRNFINVVNDIEAEETVALPGETKRAAESCAACLGDADIVLKSGKITAYPH
jgi:hypothetical protein